MEDKTRFQNSVCRRGILHKFRPISTTDEGNVERCLRCGLQKHFKEKNKWEYLSWHIRDVLRADDPMFRREYPDAEI